MLPNYKLPSLRLGIIEVVTTVAHAAVASILVASIFQLKKILLLIVNVCRFAPGWINTHNIFINTAFSQPAVIGRMVYEIKYVKRHFHNFFDKKIIETTNMCN